VRLVQSSRFKFIRIKSLCCKGHHFFFSNYVIRHQFRKPKFFALTSSHFQPFRVFTFLLMSSEGLAFVTPKPEQVNLQQQHSWFVFMRFPVSISLRIILSYKNIPRPTPSKFKFTFMISSHPSYVIYTAVTTSLNNPTVTVLPYPTAH
jgi:hypothetical protein